MLTTTIYLTHIYLAINNNLNFVLKYQIRNLKLKKIDVGKNSFF